jgi:hypothetical protein
MFTFGAVAFWRGTTALVKDFGKVRRTKAAHAGTRSRHSLSYGVLSIGSCGGPPIAAAFVSPGGPKFVFASVIAEIFLAIRSALARLKAVPVRTGAGPPVGRLCLAVSVSSLLPAAAIRTR